MPLRKPSPALLCWVMLACIRTAYSLALQVGDIHSLLRICSRFSAVFVNGLKVYRKWGAL